MFETEKKKTLFWISCKQLILKNICDRANKKGTVVHWKQFDKSRIDEKKSKINKNKTSGAMHYKLLDY